LLTKDPQRGGGAASVASGGKGNFAHLFFWAPLILIGNLALDERKPT